MFPRAAVAVLVIISSALYPFQRLDLSDKENALIVEYQKALSYMNGAKYLFDDARYFFEQGRRLKGRIRNNRGERRMRKALRLLDDIREESRAPAVYLSSAEAAALTGEYEAALSLLKYSVFNLAPNNTSSLLALGRLLYALSYEKGLSIKCFERVLESQPRNEEALYFRGELAFSEGDEFMAESFFSLLTDSSLNTPAGGGYRGHACFFLGRMSYNRGEMSNAAYYFSQAPQEYRNPEHEYYFNFLFARTLFFLSKYEAASDRFKALDAKFSLSLQSLALAYVCAFLGGDDEYMLQLHERVKDGYSESLSAYPCVFGLFLAIDTGEGLSYEDCSLLPAATVEALKAELKRRAMR